MDGESKTVMSHLKNSVLIVKKNHALKNGRQLPNPCTCGYCGISQYCPSAAGVAAGVTVREWGGTAPKADADIVPERSKWMPSVLDKVFTGERRALNAFL